MGKNLILIGFMGTGKSSVGLKVAERLKMEFVDMDKEIERITGLTIKELFRRYGEIRFRSEEKLMAAKLSKRSNLVVATGGGVVLYKENIEALRNNGIVICLEASPEDILERVSRKKGSRPLLKKNVTTKDIKQMLKEREPFYAQADYRINTSEGDLYAVVNEIVRIYNHAKLGQAGGKDEQDAGNNS
jgi:shikimate kinase